MEVIVGLAGTFLLGMLLKDTAAGISKSAAQAITRWLERRFSSSRLVRRRALRRYREDIAERYHLVPVPWTLPVELPMRDVYIPLQVSERTGDTATGGALDLATVVESSRQTMVLGAPGSGKSLFLRYLLWSFCAPPEGSDAGAAPKRRRLLRPPRRRRPDRGGRRPLPVLVPLSRLANSDDLVGEIAAAFDRHKFADARAFVERELERDDPDLILLLDGLDEVGSARRGAVARVVADFADAHPQVRFVATCRTEVYGGVLDGQVDMVLHVADFSDELVERFLRGWPPMTSPADADRLVTALRDKPRVAELVRNPLLLTMLAYLYTEEYDQSTARLPDNRTQLYAEGSGLLLQGWKPELNKYRREVKRVALQHLAVFSQRSSQERRSFSYEDALRELAQALRRLSRSTKEADAVLTEIVERSGLLITLDSGERYQFAHISMQEYFAAVELKDRPDELLRRYKSDPDAWREPLKLWCGLEVNSTEVVQTVASSDPVLALSCLAEAIRVDEDVADALIEWLKPRLGEPDPDEALVRAFGALSADSRAAGRKVLAYLREALDGPACAGAAAALGVSNLPEAARILAQSDLAATAAHLERMGNVAVPALLDVANNGEELVHRLHATTSLAAIGTAPAAVALASLLWSDDVRVEAIAAVGLVQLTENPTVEDALAEDGPELPGIEPTLHWLWAPFAVERTEAERGRIVNVLDRCRTVLENLRRPPASETETAERVHEWRLGYVPPNYLVMPDSVREHIDDTTSDVADVAVKAFGTATDETVDRHVRFEKLVTELDEEPRVPWGSALRPDDDNYGGLATHLFGSPLPPITRPLDKRVLLAAAFFGYGYVPEDNDVEDFPSIRSAVGRQAEPMPSLAQNLAPEVQRELEDAHVDFWPSAREWERFRAETPAFNLDGSAYHRIPVVVTYAVAAAIFYFALVALLKAGWPNLVALGAVAAAMTTPFWVQLGVRLNIVFGEPWAYADEFSRLLFLSPSAALDEYDEGPYGFVTALCMVGFTPALFYGLARWLHPPGLVAGIAVVVLFLLVTGVPLLYGLWAENRTYRNEGAARMLRAIFDPGSAVRVPVTE